MATALGGFEKVCVERGQSPEIGRYHRTFDNIRTLSGLKAVLQKLYLER